MTKRVLNYNSIPWSEEKEYMDSLPTPKDDIQRAYNKYKCECSTMGSKLILFFRNCAGFVLFWIYMVMPSKKIQCEEQYDVVIINGDKNKEDSVPDEYKDNYIHIPIEGKRSLKKGDKKVMFRVWKKHPFSYFFLTKIFIKLMVYSRAIQLYKPKQILCTSEASFTVPILTNYLEKQGIEHINFQHGLLAYKSRIAYSRFTKQLVWDKCFENALKKMHDDTEEFIIVSPKALNYPIKKELEEKGRYTYYLQEIDEDIIKSFAEFYYKWKEKGINLVLRPHPRYNDIDLIKKAIPDAEVEDISKVGIEDSINQSEYVIARGSTVLYQGKVMNKKVLIDDVSMRDSFEYLRDRVFEVWFENLEEYLLSNYLNKTT